MRFTVEAEIDAPLDRAWAWWTDFGEPGEEFRVQHGLGSSVRRVLFRQPGEVIFEDTSFLGRIRRTIQLGEAHTFQENAEGAQTFGAVWTFAAAGPGRTRVTRDMRVRSHRALTPIARALARVDLRHHCREAERDLARAPS